MSSKSSHVEPRSRIAMIACGVLALDCKFLANQIASEVDMYFLPGGLHASPPELRRRLQETIDEIDRQAAVSRIVIGYGLCGHGTTGIHARTVPLVIPRVHDCIALFLGSDQAYRQQFGKAPGTYYLSAGWVAEKHDTKSGMGSAQPSAAAADSVSSGEMAARYGEENAAYIDDFMRSWTRNYTRAAFIDTGVGGSKEHYAEQAKALAREHGWQYERLEGTHDLLHEALTCTATTPNMLFVPPGSQTTYDAMHGKLTCAQPGAATAHSSPHQNAPEPEAAEEHSNTQRGIGIGIDAGGTYTDAVLYDLDARVVLAKCKALTTHWDYSYGIREALAGLDPALCHKASLVAVSTTIATNAIVEHRGQAVGLLVMPPCGWATPDGFRHTPVATIKGQMTIDGIEQEAVDPDEIRTVAQGLITTGGVTAFAVGGYAAHVNPSHELHVKKIVQEATGLICTCSHELSQSLHYRIRAETAALNARIIPCLEELLQRIQSALQASGIMAPIMVVRSDGSFMNLQAACERPLETMLSGPAASAAGAGWLAQTANGLVVDIGGTTTDTALLRDGRVAMNPEGASIGGWQTHIRALDLYTAGLGGDSCIRIKHGKITIGPDRVTPLSWTATHAPGGTAAIHRLRSAAAGHPFLPDDWIMVLRTRKEPPADLSAREAHVLDALCAGPLTPHELAMAISIPHPAMLPLQNLLHLQLIAYSGFTPTDALHVTGACQIWDTQAAIIAAQSCAGSLTHACKWAESIITEFHHHLAIEIARKALHESLPDMHMTDPHMEQILAHIAKPATAEMPHLQLSMPWPIIGIGAPAAAFTPDACQRLGAQVVIPPHADVANAVGAIIGTISVRHSLRITTNESGIFRISGAKDAPCFTTIEDATEWCVQHLYQYLGTRARNAGCPNPSIAITPQDRFAPSSDGSPVFIARDIHGHAHGLPGQPIQPTLPVLPSAPNQTQSVVPALRVETVQQR
ncbi:MAG: DUF1638 domain-containing protein [Kiritimatiellia bacterium]